MTNAIIHMTRARKKRKTKGKSECSVWPRVSRAQLGHASAVVQPSEHLFRSALHHSENLLNTAFKRYTRVIFWAIKGDLPHIGVRAPGVHNETLAPELQLCETTTANTPHFTTLEVRPCWCCVYWCLSGSKRQEHLPFADLQPLTNTGRCRE